MLMRYYAVIDTNVIVSAMLKWNSVPGNILELAIEGPIIPVLNEKILEEYSEVLLRPKFHFTNKIVSDVIEAIKSRAVFIDEEKNDIELPDPKDRVFYEVVMEQRNSSDAYLVTGNIKHFPIEPFIVTPKEMLNIILSDTTE